MALKRPTEDQVIEGVLNGSPGATKVFLNKVDSRVGHLVRARGYEPFIVGLGKMAERAAKGKPRSMDVKGSWIGSRAASRRSKKSLSIMRFCWIESAICWG